jgi:hypothetical protein
MDRLGNAGRACREKVLAAMIEKIWKILYDELSKKFSSLR